MTLNLNAGDRVIWTHNNIDGVTECFGGTVHHMSWAGAHRQGLTADPEPITPSAPVLLDHRPGVINFLPMSELSLSRPSAEAPEAQEDSGVTSKGMLEIKTVTYEDGRPPEQMYRIGTCDWVDITHLEYTTQYIEREYTLEELRENYRESLRGPYDEDEIVNAARNYIEALEKERDDDH
jgi:hypothetical protein